MYAQDKGNLFFSPFSLQTSLTMMLPGATDDTYVQLTKLLGQENRPLEEVLELYKTLIDNLYEVDPSTEFRSANGMFTDKEIVLKDTFVKTASDCFSAGLETVDFSKASAAKETINRWASANTGKKISKLVDDIAYNTKIILVNALYFNGKWENPFDQSKTAKGDFHAIDGSTSKVNFMN
ncbi:MAG: serpin family protein, partial [Bacteroidales bacterium]|nr:serpin family protein [Bacteroidales bacterium]